MKIFILPICFTALTIFGNCTGTRPGDLGITMGKLKNCPNTPNCISSMADPKDEEHYMAPIPFKNLADAKVKIKEKVANHPRTEIILENETYIYVEFTTLIMRYVDDVEFFFDEKTNLLHFRSASRLGKSDLGLNRKRMNLLLKEIQI